MFKEDDGIPKMSFAQMMKKNVCYCCGQTHKLADCPQKNTTPKSQWYIQRHPQAQKYNAMVAEIQGVLAPTAATPSTISAATISTGQSAPTVATSSANEDSWHFFCFASPEHSKTEALKDTMILDSGSSTDLFCNPKLLQDIGPAAKNEVLHTNAGPIQVTEQGTLPTYGTVPFMEDGVTNIMSLAKLTDRYRVTFDSAVDNAFYVHTPQKTVRFPRTESNLYAHTPSKLKTQSVDTTGVAGSPVILVQSVEENMKFHTPREIKSAKRARDLLAAVGFPTTADLKTAIATNAIANLKVTTRDVDLAEKIFGPDLGTLKGKTTRRKPLPMVSDQIAIPPQLYENREFIELCIDLMFVNSMPFFTSISRALYYRTARPIPTRTREVLLEGLDFVLRLYNANGFTVSKIYCDNEFRPLFEAIIDDLEVDVEYSPAKAHVPEAERNNRTLKERIRAAYHRLPFKALPKAIMKILVMEAARKLNYFPAKYGISQHYSPRQIMHQQTLDYEKHCKFVFGSYVQAHDEPAPTNTQAARTIDAIYLRPVDNGASHEVYDLSTQEIIDRRDLTPLPITKAVIDTVNAIAEREHQKGLRMTSKTGKVLYDSSWTAGVDYDSDEEYDSDSECSTTDAETESDSDEESTTTAESHDSSEEERILLQYPGLPFRTPLGIQTRDSSLTGLSEGQTACSRMTST